ncbi:MAG: 30S ribosomal protein S20 [Lentisphaeria bacterium]|nr:30S ribosomal protein S20 [Lentisphaeria bacterium]
MPKKEVRKSAVKTFKQSERVRLKNKSVRSALWTAEKKLRAAVAEGSKETAADLLQKQYSILDKAVKYGTLHKNTASRKKARLAVLVATAGKAEAAAE